MKRQIFLAIGMAILTSFAYAGPKQGDSEVSFLVNATSTDASTVTLANVNAGRLITDSIEWAVSITGIWSDDATVGMVGTGVDYNFSTASDNVPYVGLYLAELYYDVGGTDDSNASYDVHVGIKQFLNERTAVNYRLTYADAFSSDYDVQQTSILIGLTYYF